MSQVDNLIPDHIKSSLSDAEVDSDGEINMDRVPFAKNTIRMDLKQIDKSLKAMSSQQNKDRIKTEQDENQNRNCTPVNENEPPGQPLTPTANLKVLFNAMSPELRNRDEQRQSASDEDSPFSSQEYQFETIIEVPTSNDVDSKFGPSRKEKSLGLLCQRFLQMYPENPEAGEVIVISLDEVAKELQVERRRIYDIVNVLESVEIVSRMAKNKYAWHGKKNLHTTLAKLKALGDSEGFGEQIQRLKDFEFNRELEEQFGRSDPRLKGVRPDFSIFGESSLFNQALRKDKSLGIMSQKFLMLFLVSKPKTVNLDLSAKLLIGDANVDRTENSKFKTKIRRLYDIANILTSLNLIRKVHVTEIRGRKPAFKYIGPDIDNPTDVCLTCCSDGCHRPSSKHSMLDCIQNGKVAKLIDSYKAGQDGKKGEDDTGKSAFGRHSSFETLCAVASEETNKLNNSAPSSPCKVLEKPDGTEGGQMHIHSSDESETKLPTRGFVRKKILGKFKEREPADQACKTDAVIIRTKAGGSNLKQPTVIPLTKEQIDAVLRSLKVPIPVRKGLGVDATTQSSPLDEPLMTEEQGQIETDLGEVKAEPEEEVVVMRQLNEKTPVITINTPEKVVIKRPAQNGDSIPLDKRIKLDFDSTSDEQSPVLGENTLARLRKKVNDVKPSPQRALHLAPEFVNPTDNMAPSGDASVSENGEKTQPKKIEIIINESGVQTGVLKNKAIGSPKRVVLEIPSQSQSMLVQSPVSVCSRPNPAVLHVSGQSNSILHLPVVNLDRSQSNIQIIQGGQMVHMPCVASSAGLVPATNARVYTINPQTSQTSLAFTNVQLVQQTSPRGPNNVATLIRPVATKAVASPKAGSQIVAPQILNQSPVYIRKSPGGFVPITNNSVSIPKVIVASSNITVSQMPSTSVLTEATM